MCYFVIGSIVLLALAWAAFQANVQPKDKPVLLGNVLSGMGFDQRPGIQQQQMREIFDTANDQRAALKEKTLNGPLPQSSRAGSSATEIKMEQDRIKQLQKERMRDVLEQGKGRTQE